MLLPTDPETDLLAMRLKGVEIQDQLEEEAENDFERLF